MCDQYYWYGVVHWIVIVLHILSLEYESQDTKYIQDIMLHNWTQYDRHVIITFVLSKFNPKHENL